MGGRTCSVMCGLSKAAAVGLLIWHTVVVALQAAAENNS